MDACIPLPLQIVIDDVGWRHGRDGSRENQPYRTGVDRLHGPADYQAIVQFGRALGMCPLAAFVLGDWDTQNQLRQIPTASWLGAQWDNRANNGPWLAECAALIRQNRAHLEVGLHGIMHEYWLDGVATRAEWHDDAHMLRPRSEVRARLDLFLELVAEHRLGPLPRVLVPPAARHNFGAPGENFAALVQPYGIQAIFNEFAEGRPQARPLDYPWFGFDRGVITVQRSYDLFPWNQLAPVPQHPPHGPVCSMHWANLLHADPARNAEIVDGWVRVLRPLADQFDRLLAPNTEAFLAQLVHHTVTRVRVVDDELEVDAREYFQLPWSYRPALPVTVKVRRAGRIERWPVPVTAAEPVRRLRLPPSVAAGAAPLPSRDPHEI